MNKTRDNLKNYSGKLSLFLVLNSLAFIVFALQINLPISEINVLYNEYYANSGLVLVSSYLIVFVLNGVLSSDLKAKLVFWRTTYVYPGFRVFTELSSKDSRIDKAELERKYGILPTIPKNQNQLWYKMYKKFEFHPMIFASHRNFLLSRDLTGFSFLFVLTYPIAVVVSAVIFKEFYSSLFWYLGYLVAQYMVCALVSRNYGNRFACSVLAQASSNENNKVSE